LWIVSVVESSAPHPKLDFQALFDAAPGIYLVLTPSFEMVAANEARLRATMTVRENIIGRNLFDLFPDNPDDPGATGVRNLRASLERVLRTRLPDTMAVQKYDIRRPESEGGGFEVRYWSPMNLPVLGADGEVAYIIHRVEDVTDFMRLKQEGARLQSHADRIENEIYLRAQEVQAANHRFEAANAELAQLYAKTKELDATKTRFFANISHELRTPLTLIIGPVEKLLSGSDLDAEQRRTLEVVERNARLLLHHVNDLLDISKLDAGKMEVRYWETDLARLLRAMGGHFETVAQDRGITFRVEAPATALAETDTEKVQRVLLNLMSNAFKFTPDGGAITCRLRLEDELAHVSVEDSGPGVPAHLRQLIFEPFRQGEEEATRRFGGTGLGLAIAKEFLELLRGDIRVGDAAAGGALFEAWFPLSAPPGAEVLFDAAPTLPSRDLRQAIETERTQRGNVAVSGARGDRALILVVEDNREMNNFIAEGLASQFYVARAYNGREGLNKAVELRPDLILSDMMMPELSGDQLVEALRADPLFEQTPIILLTAKADDETRVALLRGGVQDVLTKPFNSDELLVRVTNLLEAKRASDIVHEKRRVSEEKRRLLMEHARDAFLILDDQGQILEANKEASALFKAQGGALEGRRFTDLASAAGRENGADLLSDVMTARCPAIDALALDICGRKSVYVDASSTRLNIEGEIVVFVTLRDVSERVALQEQLRQSQKLEAMGQLTGGIAHDFNNLLTAVMANTEALKARLADRPELSALAASTERAAERGAAMTRRLLAFARRQPIALRVCDVNRTVSESVEMLRRVLPGNVTIEGKLDPDLWPALLDPSQLEDALLNLVINARDAMPGGGAVVIETSKCSLSDHAACVHGLAIGDYARIAVADNGAGMDFQTMQRAFEPFFTTKEDGRGTGLGLSMVHGFAHQAGGDVRIESTPGRGTKVTMLLPRARTDDVVGAPQAVSR
jgi:PAS domain S-box-containing protein